MTTTSSLNSSHGATSAASSSDAINQTGTSALSSLSGNFSDFLSMLMTQLKNQDPTTPMDSNQFTSELVQFTSVEQQIDTNTALGQLIQLTQASQVEQSAGMLGKPVTVKSTELALQNGQAGVNFNTPTSEPVTIAIYNGSGAMVRSESLTSTTGANSWTWNGDSNGGASLPDGAYKVTVSSTSSTGSTTSLPFTITGTATAVTNSSGTVDLSMGSLSVPFSQVQSVGN